MESHSKENAVEKHNEANVVPPESPEVGAYDHDVENGDKGIVNKTAPLHRDLKSRHMQMIAIGM